MPSLLLRSASVFKFLGSNPLIAFIVAFVALGAFGGGLKYLDEDARRQRVGGPHAGKGSWLNAINPFLAPHRRPLRRRSFRRN